MKTRKFIPPPGLVPPVMLNWVWPLGRAIGADTAVLRPDGVIGGWARETEHRMVKNSRLETYVKSNFTSTFCGDLKHL